MGVSDEDNRPARGTLLNLCCVCVFYAAHLVMLIYGTIQTWSSTCRQDAKDLFDDSRKYSIAAWILFLAGPMFLGFCYCLGAAIDICLEDRLYEECGKRHKAGPQRNRVELEQNERLMQGAA